ncbi:MAG: alpha/beta hydrolase fold domain-containing protein [Clostridia bacterium]|nr:alpha/beta hydrolase fold domain-containing protein [Clostridia bacterium]
MRPFTKFLRSQISFFKGFIANCSLETVRRHQDRLGKFMASFHKSEVNYEDILIGDMEACMISPRDELSRGIILYLHGGGYTCGDLDYAKGFATMLCAKCGIKVLCVAYRLAPEHVFPAAIDDSMEAYGYLLSHGYAPESIILCGESAGGGLCYSLCLKLREKGRVMPAGIIAISPWTDMTASSKSYEENRKADPTMTIARLKYYSDFYLYGLDEKGKKKARPLTNPDPVDDFEKKSNPLVSPALGELDKLPPCLVFVGGDEIMLGDAQRVHEGVINSGGRSELIVTPKMWHGYLLYGLKENEGDFGKIRRFIKEIVPLQKKLKWMSLDNAAKIYPAARRRDWSNVFRISATLSEKIDKETMQVALDVTVRRFPSIAVRLKRGFFWYYLEEIPKAPEIMDEKPYPLARMIFDDIRKCAFRVIVYENRVALEFFHAVTDGNGGLIFLKSLIAEYLYQKYGIKVPNTHGVYDRLEEPNESEWEDSFHKHAGSVKHSRWEKTAFKIVGKAEPDGFRTNTTFIMDADQIKNEAKRYGVSVTAFFVSILICTNLRIQESLVHYPSLRKPVKILVPVNLRNLYPSNTLRNFVLYTTPGVDPRYGEYTFEEICKIVYHQMSLEVTPKQMSARIATNVGNENTLILKLAPLFLKNMIMKLAFKAVGEKKSTFSFSNMGVVTMPQEMAEFVTRVDVLLGVQSTAPYNSAMVTYGGKTYLNIIRNIKDSILERELYNTFKELGLKVVAESNSRPNRKKKN